MNIQQTAVSKYEHRHKLLKGGLNIFLLCVIFSTVLSLRHKSTIYLQICTAYVLISVSTTYFGWKVLCVCMVSERIWPSGHFWPSVLSAEGGQQHSSDPLNGLSGVTPTAAFMKVANTEDHAGSQVLKAVQFIPRWLKKSKAYIFIDFERHCCSRFDSRSA